jgi:RNA polymerase-binding protein DksA
MKDSDRQHLEQRLLEERDRVNRSLERLDEVACIASEDDGELTQYRQHLADDGTDTESQEKGLALLSREGRLLTRIDETLLRLYKEPDQYGKCERCGQEIDVARLDLVPWARFCIECKELEEAS